MRRFRLYRERHFRCIAQSRFQPPVNRKTKVLARSTPFSGVHAGTGASRYPAAAGLNPKPPAGQQCRRMRGMAASAGTTDRLMLRRRMGTILVTGVTRIVPLAGDAGMRFRKPGAMFSGGAGR